MFCRKQHAEIGLEASKITVLLLKIKRNAPKELEALIHENSCQTLTDPAESLGVDHTTVSKLLKALGMIQKQFHWVSYQLRPRNVEQRLFTCEQPLQRQKRKGLLHHIVTGDQKWIHYDNPKRRKSQGEPGHAST
ncbi:Mariner Mos1 transposase [Araneus ventricosus]|uniref:Mariner Mos1 transposase n=1 Tax=Araneus ventricosus TaxID=182803 RepID=A0A4Y2EE65_ARAVE|nr:Mariner Mos1 transposase [Araneus ventricosus]